MTFVANTYNTKIYHHLIIRVVDNEDDYYWLANKMGKLHQDISKHDSCIDATRVSKVQADGGWDQKYADTISCCGQANREVHNPKTGNSFWIGFNYGH